LLIVNRRAKRIGGAFDGDHAAWPG